MDHENPAFGPHPSKYIAKETEAKASLTRAAATTEYIDKYITGRSCLTPGDNDDVFNEALYADQVERFG